MCSGFRLERQCECLAIAGLVGSRKEARRAEALPVECTRIERRMRGRRRKRWEGERTWVVVMSRAQANCAACCQRPCARAPTCTEQVGEGRSHFFGDGCFLAVEKIQRKSRVREWTPRNSPRIRTGSTKEDQKAEFKKDQTRKCYVKKPIFLNPTHHTPGAGREITEVKFRRSQADRAAQPIAQTGPTIGMRA